MPSLGYVATSQNLCNIRLNINGLVSMFFNPASNYNSSSETRVGRTHNATLRQLNLVLHLQERYKMDPLLLASFLLVAVVIIIIPGPNVLIIVSTSITHSIRAGLLTVAGTTVAMAVQLTVAVLGTTWFVDNLLEGFLWLRWLGVAYLLYLGIQHLNTAIRNQETIQIPPTAPSSFLRGFIVSLTNPKTIVFFSAFLPQFASVNFDYLPQIAILSTIFLCTASVLDSMYALLANRARDYFEKHSLNPLQSYVSGILLITSGLWLALSRRV